MQTSSDNLEVVVGLLILSGQSKDKECKIRRDKNEIVILSNEIEHRLKLVNIHVLSSENEEILFFQCDQSDDLVVSVKSDRVSLLKIPKVLLDTLETKCHIN